MWMALLSSLSPLVGCVRTSLGAGGDDAVPWWMRLSGLHMTSGWLQLIAGHHRPLLRLMDHIPVTAAGPWAPLLPLVLVAVCWSIDGERCRGLAVHCSMASQGHTKWGVSMLLWVVCCSFIALVPPADSCASLPITPVTHLVQCLLPTPAYPKGYWVVVILISPTIAPSLSLPLWWFSGGVWGLMLAFLLLGY